MHDWYQLAFADYVAVSIAHFVCFEVGDLIETLSRLGPIATGWPWAVIAVLRMETVIYVAMEVGWAVKPRARPNEDPSYKPFRATTANARMILNPFIKLSSIGRLSSTVATVVYLQPNTWPLNSEILHE